MTRQEAIERLEICQNVCDDCLTCASHDDALDMAIAALREQSVPDTDVVKTNADHIRSMTDEELARFHLLECPRMAEVYGECKYGWHDREQTCEECMLEWLKQPYKEENT
jgi:1,2-phenylacetyl-CoA epoxidase PaaB subunit